MGCALFGSWIKNSTNQKGHEPKTALTKKGTNQKQHKPKRAQTKKGTNQKQQEPQTAHTKKGHEPKTCRKLHYFNQNTTCLFFGIDTQQIWLAQTKKKARFIKGTNQKQHKPMTAIWLECDCKYFQCTRKGIPYIALLFGIHFSSLIEIEANVDGLVHITKPPTLGL